MEINRSIATRWLCSLNPIIRLLALAGGMATAQAGNLTWNTTTGTWDIGITANWTGDATVFANGDNVNFDNPAGGIVTIDAAGVAPGSLTNSAASGIYTFNNGTIGGSGALVMNGGGTLVLQGTNTYSGGTYVNAGQLAVASSTAAFGSGSVTVASGGNVGFTGGTTANTTNAFTLSGTGNGVGAGALRFLSTGTVLNGPITLGGDASLTGLGNIMAGTIDLGSFTLTDAKNAAVSESWSAVISGAGGLTMAGANGTTILALTGVNAYSGPTTLTLGELSVSAPNNFGAPAASLVFNGGTLRITGTTLASLSGLGHTVVLNGPTVGLDIASNTFTADMALTQSGGLTKLGAGKLVLNQANSYSGVTTVSAGMLQLAGGTGSAIPSGGAAVTLAGGTLDMNGQTQTIYNLQTSGATTNVLTDSSGGGVLTTVYASTAQRVQTGSILTLSGGTLNAGTSGQFVNNGNLTVASGTLIVANELLNAFTTPGAVVNLNSGVINAGMISFGNSSCTYNLNGGTVKCSNFKNRGAGAVDLFFNGVTVQANTQNANGWMYAMNAGQTYWISTNGVTFDTAGLSYTGKGALTHNTALGATADGGLTKIGTGTLTLSATNTYTGTTTVSGGTLTESATGYIADTSPLTVNGSNAVFALGANHSDTVGTVTVTNGGTITGSGSSTLTVGAGTFEMQNGTVSAALAGAGIPLNKTTAGTVTLSGTNTYSGATTISNSELLGLVGGSCSNSAVTVAATAGNTAALGVSITDNTKKWTCPSVTVNNAGTSSGLDFNFGSLAPSASVAPLKVSGAATFTTTPTVTVEVVAANVTVGAGYPLMTWGSTSGTTPTSVAVTTTGRSSVTGHLTVVGSTLNLVIDTSASTEPLRWTGGPGTWDLNNSGNLIWKDNASASTYFQTGDSVVFDNVVGSGGTVTLNTLLSPVSVIVSNTTAYTFSGSGGIAGAPMRVVNWK